MPPQVWGYLLHEENLLKYGLERGMGNTDNYFKLQETLIIAGEDLLRRAGVLGRVFITGAYNHKGKFTTCFALACVGGDPEHNRPKPPREVIDAVKKVINTEKEPSWFKQVA